VRSRHDCRRSGARAGGWRPGPLVTRRDVPLRQKLAHRRKVAALRTMERETAGMDEPCIIGWHSLVIRTTGFGGAMLHPSGEPARQHLPAVAAATSGTASRMRSFRASSPASSRRRRLERRERGDGRPMCAGKGSETCPIKRLTTTSRTCRSARAECGDAVMTPLHGRYLRALLLVIQKNTPAYMREKDPSPRHFRAGCCEVDSRCSELRAPVPTLSRGGIRANLSFAGRKLREIRATWEWG